LLRLATAKSHKLLILGAVTHWQASSVANE